MSHKHSSHRYERLHESSSVVSKRHTSPPPADLLFTIDRKGDAQNLRYGSIDKYKVPKYRTIGGGRLLGLDRRFKIVSRSETERQLDNEAIDASSKSHAFPLLLKRQAAESPSAPLKADPASRTEFVEQQDYVALGRKRRRWSNDSNGQSTALARTERVNSASSESTSGSDGESTSGASESKEQAVEQDAFEKFKNHVDNRKHIELRKRIDQDPQNANAWLELIHHQDRYFMLSISKTEGDLNASQIRTVTDMRISLYEKAIATVKDKQAKEILMLGLMQEGSKIWETDKQLKEWRSVLRSTKSIELWYKYLNFQQTNPIIFACEKCLDTYVEIFKLTSGLNDEDHDYHCTYLALRLTTFMFEAGFAERAIAIWQALLEYNLFKPGAGHDGIEAFESFWESENLRVGEEGARGWFSHNEQEVPPKTDSDLSNLNAEHLFSDWSRVETQRSVRHVMPARTLDNTVEDDPFRVILFSDVKEFLFRTKSDQGRQYLTQGVLKFCGLPPVLDVTARCRTWWIDPMLCDFDPGVMIGELTDTNILYHPPELLAPVWNVQRCKERGILDFGLCVLAQLSELQRGDDQLAEYTVGLYLQINPKSARKLAKKLLKQRPNSLRLYNIYALVEIRDNKIDVANNVWSTALSMADSLGSLGQQHKVLLWHSWIWELMIQKQFNQVRHLLIEVIPSEAITTELLQAASRLQVTSSIQQLRAGAYFREKIAYQAAQNSEMIVEFTALFAMLRYLCSGQDLQEALTTYRTTLSAVSQQACLQILERIHQSRALFTHIHARSSDSGFRPMQLLPVLEESLVAFPDNSMFFGLHEIYVKHAGMVDRVRMTGLRSGNSTGTISPLLHAISKEILRPTYSGSTVHSIRRTFANATAAESETCHSPNVWLLWLKWEASLITLQPEVHRRQVREVYLAALRHCPWHKELYLQGFVEQNLHAALGTRALERVFRSMSERGIRIRHDISEMLDDREGD